MTKGGNRSGRPALTQGVPTMNRWFGPALKAAAFTTSLALPSASTAYGQRWFRPSPGDYYGVGANGTIGRGTLILPGGPLDGQPPDQTGWGVPSVTYSSGYVSARPAAAPYLTTRTYE